MEPIHSAPEADCRENADGSKAALDRLLALLHDGGDPAAIRLCDELAIPVDPARRGSLSRLDLADESRQLAKSFS